MSEMSSIGSPTRDALRRLAQCLYRGATDHDDLRAIVEGWPAFGQALAKERGLTMGNMMRQSKAGRTIPGRELMTVLYSLRRA
jgi:tape measure domain-containing protein